MPVARNHSKASQRTMEFDRRSSAVPNSWDNSSTLWICCPQPISSGVHFTKSAYVQAPMPVARNHSKAFNEQSKDVDRRQFRTVGTTVPHCGSAVLSRSAAVFTLPNQPTSGADARCKKPFESVQRTIKRRRSSAVPNSWDNSSTRVWICCPQPISSGVQTLPNQAYVVGRKGCPLQETIRKRLNVERIKRSSIVGSSEQLRQQFHTSVDLLSSADQQRCSLYQISLRSGADASLQETIRKRFN